MKITKVLLFAWYFIAWLGSDGSIAQFGPFDNQAACQEISKSLDHVFYVTACWSYGEQPKQAEKEQRK